MTLNSDGGVDTRFTSLFGLLRYGVTRNFELRLDSPVYNQARVSVNGHSATESGYGDVEVGAKWHLFDNQGARPSFALIPSVILPTGEKNFTADDPVYQLNAMAEWNLASGWGIGALAGYLNRPVGRRPLRPGDLRSLARPLAAVAEVERLRRGRLRRHRPRRSERLVVPRRRGQVSRFERFSARPELRSRPDRRLARLAVRLSGSRPASEEAVFRKGNLTMDLVYVARHRPLLLRSPGASCASAQPWTPQRAESPREESK